jgi:hypothetical protein
LTSCIFLYVSEVDVVLEVDVASDFVVLEADTANHNSMQALTFALFLFAIHHISIAECCQAHGCFLGYMRCKLCGEAAFLPLVATGHGALNAEAIALLNEGYVVRLLDDSEGRTVIYIDRSRFQTLAASFEMPCCN